MCDIGTDTVASAATTRSTRASSPTLNGDTLKLVFNETGKSTSTIAGVTFNPNGLGLSSAVVGTDFIDNAATNKVLTALNTASTTLRSQASAGGAGLPE